MQNLTYLPNGQAFASRAMQTFQKCKYQLVSNTSIDSLVFFPYRGLLHWQMMQRKILLFKIYSQLIELKQFLMRIVP